MSLKSPANRLRPDFSFEDACPGPACGLDEVGRAPLAGPVVAACVYIPPATRSAPLWREVNDSKSIPKKKRETLATLIRECSIWAIAEASVEEIENLNIVGASFLAMQRAYAHTVHKGSKAVHALIDGHLSPRSFPCDATPIVKGDSKSVSIAAASIIAKVYRDTLMEKLALEHPGYGWERNAAYPTPEHLRAIRTLGLTPHHRKTFAPVRAILETGLRIKIPA